MRWMLNSVLLLAMGCSATTVQGQELFSSNMNDGTGWTTIGTFDSFAVLGYNYSIDGIPEAPNFVDGDLATRGIKLEVNTSDGGQIHDISAIPVDESFLPRQFTGQYTVEVDVWLNFSGPASSLGSTEFAGVFVGHPFLTEAREGAGFMYDSDGDTSQDYRLYKNTEVQPPTTTQYSEPLGELGDSNNSDNPILVAAFPEVAAPASQNNDAETLAGSGGFQWMTIKLEVDPTAVGEGPNPEDLGVMKVSITSAASGNTVRIGAVDNSQNGAASMEGGIALAMADVFTSVSPAPQFSFAIFDNLRVTEGITQAGPAADFNKDGVVDGDDFLIWQQAFGTTSGATANTGDANGDGAVNGDDFLIWQQQFGADSGGNGMGVVPEPATSGLVVLLAATWMLGVRRQSPCRCGPTC